MMIPWQKPLTFRWEKRGDRWHLEPSLITVAPEADWGWRIYLADAPGQLKYTSEIGAKVDAWQFALKKSKALFGTRNIKLKD